MLDLSGKYFLFSNCHSGKLVCHTHGVVISIMPILAPVVLPRPNSWSQVLRVVLHCRYLTCPHQLVTDYLELEPFNDEPAQIGVCARDAMARMCMHLGSQSSHERHQYDRSQYNPLLGQKLAARKTKPIQELNESPLITPKIIVCASPTVSVPQNHQQRNSLTLFHLEHAKSHRAITQKTDARSRLLSPRDTPRQVADPSEHEEHLDESSVPSHAPLLPTTDFRTFHVLTEPFSVGRVSPMFNHQWETVAFLLRGTIPQKVHQSSTCSHHTIPKAPN